MRPGAAKGENRDRGGGERRGRVGRRVGEAVGQLGQPGVVPHHERGAPLGGKLPYDYLLETCDATLVKMELDLCWITVAGADPLVYFKRYPGRFPLVHVKDWQGQGGKMEEQATRMRNVGQGDVDFKRIFAQSDEAGIKHYIVENDAAKSVDDIASSYKYLTDLRY